MNLATLGTRGTDVVVAGLKLPRRFKRIDLIESYGKVRCDRDGDGALPKEWRQGISNELHRLSSDFAQFHKEGRRLDLIMRVGSGEYSFRDEVRPKLIEAANERADLLVTQNMLVLPIEVDAVASVSVSNLIGVYAHQKIMTFMRSTGYEIIKDTSTGRAYDFTFWGPNRFHSPQIMECKGTARADGDIVLTPYEQIVMGLNAMNYWLGVVYSIEIADGNAFGGTVSITSPPILEKWQFTRASPLRRISDAPNLLF